MTGVYTQLNESCVWQITGRTGSAPLADKWRGLLAARLGQRPRRIGILAELALYGALECLDAAREAVLPQDVVLRVCSLHGPVDAIRQVLEQNREELPMPFSFLQSQTSQLLPALVAALQWQGDAGIVMARDRMQLATLAAQQAGPSGMLLGWVEESPCSSDWLRLARCDTQPDNFVMAASFEEMISPETRYWRLGRDGMEIAPG
jgi:hypothetical protein